MSALGEPTGPHSERRRVTFSLRRSDRSLTIEASGVEGSAWRDFGWLHAPVNRPVRVALTDPRLEYRWSDGAIDPHGDALAASALFAFFPLLARQPVEVTFDWPTSARVSTGVGLLPADMTVGRCGVSEPLDPIEASVLSFGGGMDSLSMTVLYPDARPVYEAPLSLFEGRMTSAVTDGDYFKERDGLVVFTNQRSLYDTWGVGSWPSVLMAALFTGHATIVTGLNALDNAFLTKGYGYREPRTTVDFQFFAFLEHLGFRVVQTMWKSEVVSAALLEKSALLEESAYCGRIPTRDCGRCSKCLRRRMLKTLVTGDKSVVEAFDPDHGTIAALTERPLGWGHVYGLAFQKKLLPAWLRTHVIDAVTAYDRLDFLERYYHPALLPSRVTAAEIPLVLAGLEENGLAAMSHADQLALTAFR